MEDIFTDLHHFDISADRLMRAERIDLPGERSALIERIRTDAQTITSQFNSPHMARLPDRPGGRTLSDPEVIGFLRRRFRAALADSLRTGALAESNALPDVKEQMDNIARRARRALTEIDLGRSGSFASLMPPIEQPEQEQKIA